ncbi:inositol phosphoceramide mannosyltransferase [Acrasis kona]|uniref:Inositol phosphoceramide mannosyltransferase n=1 Tax=Acrasis kona TaxID=1008807 RepID=A0AAW2ZI88_9EUKA
MAMKKSNTELSKKKIILMACGLLLLFNIVPIVKYFFGLIKPFIITIRNTSPIHFTPSIPVPLDSKTISKAIGGVPKVIHQSWKNKEIPYLFKQWQNTWLSTHKDWEYVLWTDEDNRELVKQHYPWFLRTYDSYAKGVMRADSARCLYMHRYGGVYADLDMESLRPTEDLLRNTIKDASSDKPVAIMGYMSDHFYYEHNVPNAWMISTPGHPFWLFCLSKMIELEAKGVNGAEYLTGPVMLYKAINEYSEIKTLINGKEQGSITEGENQIHDLIILKPSLIYPISWYRPRSLPRGCESLGGIELKKSETSRIVRDVDKCKAAFPEAYTITYWTHSW